MNNEFLNLADDLRGGTFRMIVLTRHCLLLRRFDFSRKAGEAGELEARETGDEHTRDHAQSRSCSSKKRETSGNRNV